MNVSLNTGTETIIILWVFTKKCSFGHFEQVLYTWSCILFKS